MSLPQALVQCSYILGVAAVAVVVAYNFTRAMWLGGK
jgi:hypothetical protein